MSSSQVIVSSATDYVRFPLWVFEDFDMGAATWQISFNPQSDQTATPVNATVVADDGTPETAIYKGVVQPDGRVKSGCTVQVLVGSGPSGNALAESDWYVYAHTTSGLRIIVFYVGTLTVN